MRLTNVDLDVPTETYVRLREQLEEQKTLLSVPVGFTIRDYLLALIIPLGVQEAERRMLVAKAPSIITP